MGKKLTSTKAKKILHDKTVHGKPLTDKQRKFFGAVASGAIPQAQNGIEGTMGGLTDKGFNYNGAWGGTMQMGGAMPGAVGFTYARTAGAAPANGPYAKKTKASAQSGKKVKEDSNLENIVEIIDPTGVTSWDDVYRSYKKTGMSPETGLEIFGALPMIGKVGKIGKFAEAAAKTFAATGRQKRNAKAVAETLKGVGKYGPTAGRSTDAYQTYDQWENGGSMKYYQEGLDFKPKTISQDGSIISPLGQWAYPGEITTIPSNEITMQGVPYPVLGISDIGDTQMMYPGEDYTFDGEYVTEYPMAQKGISVPAPTTADSARLYNAQVALNNFYNKEIKAGRIKKTAVVPTFGEFYIPNRQLNYQNLGFYRDEIAYRKKTGKGTYDEEYKQLFNLSPEQVRDLENRGLAQTKSGSNYQQYYRDVVTPMQNLAAPFALVDERIVPQRTISYSANNITYPGGDVLVYDYDPLAIKPYNMRTPQEKIEWEKKYGNPPVTLKPKPIVKPIVKPKERPPLQKVERLERPSLETPSVVGTNKQVEQKKTEYSYTVPTFDKDVQKTMYFPDEKSFKEFTDKYGYTNRSLTNKSGSATGYPQFKDGGVSVNEADAQPIKKLDQLLNFTNYNDMAKAKKGKKLPKAQGGFEQALGSLNTDLSSMGGIGGATGQLLGGVQTLIEEGKQRKKTQQALALSDITAKAATSRPVGLERKYVRPEDMLVDPGQISSPYGTGLDFLQMEDGGFIGGNPTEIQNMYNPGDLYSDLGYEPLNDSSKVKQFKEGGKAFYGMETTNTTTTAFPFGTTGSSSNMNSANLGQIGSTLGSFIGGGGGQQSGASQIGSAVGGIAGTAFGPVGSMIGSGLGGLFGGLIGAQGQKRMEQKQRRIQGNLGSAALQQSLQGQFSGFMEHGGELKYLSHTWQPQTITKFGDYDVKDLLAPPKDADMLRAGGHLKAYTPPSEAAMSTERPMEMGGNLTIDNRGDIDFLGYNPETAKTGASGYIGITRGPSHDNGGFNLNYSGSGVEVEGNETVIERKEGGPVGGNKSLVILGDMKTGTFGNEILEGVDERLAKKVLKGKKIEDVKFKQLGNQVAKLTGKLNKSESKFIDLANSVDGNSSFDLLQLNTAKTALSGINMQYKGLNKFQQNAIDVQSSYHDAAEERGYDDTPKFLSDIKKGKIKSSDMAKFGAKMQTAQNGIVQYLTSQKQDASFANRKKLAESYGIKNYKGTGAQNTQLLNAVKSKINIPSIGQPTPAQIAAEEAAFFPGNQPSGYVAPDMFESLVGGQDELPYETLASKTALPTGAQLMAMEIGNKKSRKKAIDAFLPKEASSEDKSNFNLMDFTQQLTPFVRPLIQNRLDPAQLTPEMMALATNVIEPVQAQQFRPMLEEVPTISFQDQLNEIQAEANAARRMVGNNPAAQAAIASQAANAKNKILGEQLRTNLMMQIESRRRNLATLNDATLKNLAILDQQQVRQSQARSATRAQAQEALSSIAEKIGRNKAETLAANVMSNMYPQFGIGPKGRVFPTGFAQFNIPNIAPPTTDSKTARNGSIVKAIKNL